MKVGRKGKTDLSYNVLATQHHCPHVLRSWRRIAGNASKMWDGGLEAVANTVVFFFFHLETETHTDPNKFVWDLSDYEKALLDVVP